MRAGVVVRIKQLCASTELSHRLREMGLGEEQTVKLVSAHANLICQVCNARLAISDRLAAMILVESVQLPQAA
jgi:Fe2+ transport system protein FeoA